MRLPLLVEDEAWRCALSWLSTLVPNSWSRPDGGAWEEWQHGHVGLVLICFCRALDARAPVWVAFWRVTSLPTGRESCRMDLTAGAQPALERCSPLARPPIGTRPLPALLNGPGVDTPAHWAARQQWSAAALAMGWAAAQLPLQTAWRPPGPHLNSAAPAAVSRARRAGLPSSACPAARPFASSCQKHNTHKRPLSFPLPHPFLSHSFPFLSSSFSSFHLDLSFFSPP